MTMNGQAHGRVLPLDHRHRRRWLSLGLIMLWVSTALAAVPLSAVDETPSVAQGQLIAVGGGPGGAGAACFSCHGLQGQGDAGGEYISMRAQVELLERLLVEAREAIRTNPEREHAVLQDTMQRHGFGEATARAATRELSRDHERALTVYSRAVLGMNPEELGSPWTSALSSLATFAVGAMVPLVPWFLTTGLSAVAGSLALAGGAALAIGGLLGQLTGGRWRRSALRQLVVVALASGITFLVGRLFGTTVF
jgi:vacuolar iron transporter family protein